MIAVRRLGHATLTTPDLERQVAYYTEVVGLTLLARDKNRVILASKQGLEAIALKSGDPAVTSSATTSRSITAMPTRCGSSSSPRWIR